jgi:dTDP-glucose pyrophosphorylase
MKSIQEYVITQNETCLAALTKLDGLKSQQTLFVIDDCQKVIGTITDGDIRRGFLKGLTLETPIINFSYPQFKFIDGKINVAKIKKLKQDGIKIVPKLTPEGKIERIYNLSELKSIIPVHTVIMAGGRGERLKPLTDSIPKPMLPLGDKPIIEHTIDRLISYGIEHITISVNYLAEQIIDYFGSGRSKGINISYINENKPLGTIGCLSVIKEFLHSTILVMNSDIFTNIDLEEFFLNFIEEKAEMSVASIPYSVDIPYAIIDLKQNQIKGFKEKPKNTYYANAGIYLIRKKNIKMIPKNKVFNATDFMDLMINSNRKIIHSPITGYWIDIGKLDDYNKSKELIKHL